MAQNPGSESTMQSGGKFAGLGGIAALLLYLATACVAQDLGEVARQQRLKKAASPSADRHVITNEDIHSSSSPPAADSSSPPKETADRRESAAKTPDSKAETKEEKQPSVEEVKQAILAQKRVVSSLESEIKRIAEEQTRLARALEAGGACQNVFLIGTAHENVCGLPEKLVAEKSRLQAQLDRERTTLEEMQEAARRMGYGSSVYDVDPD